MSTSKHSRFRHWLQHQTFTSLLKTCLTLTIYCSLETPTFRLPDHIIYSFCFIYILLNYWYKHRKVYRREFLNQEAYSLYLHLIMMPSSSWRKFSFFSFRFERSWFICSSIVFFIDKIFYTSDYDELFALVYDNLF